MSDSKRIVFIGNFGVDYSSESHYRKTFKAMGHQLISMQEGRVTGDQIVEQVTKDTFMLFWVHTHGWVTEGIEKVFEHCKKLNVPIVGYHLDLWMGLERQKDLDTDPYWDIDYFFTVDKLMADYLNGHLDKPTGIFMPAGVFEGECYDGTFREEFACDVAFVGSKNYHKEWPYRKLLIDFLEMEYGDRFRHVGGGSKFITHLRGRDLNDFYASAKVVVGDTLCIGYHYPFYLSDRLFETMGRGGFIIHPYIKGIREFLKEGRHGFTYRFLDFSQLKSKIDYALSQDAEREDIRKEGSKSVREDHTYTNRLTDIVNIIEKRHYDKE